MIPLEDNFDDVINKAQRGLKLSDERLAEQAGVSPEELDRAKAGQFDERVVRKLALVLGLGEDAIVILGQKMWRPRAQEVLSLAAFNTPFEGMTVNAYLVWDHKAKLAAVFDTGSDTTGLIQFARDNHLTATHVFLTHSHYDHVFDLPRLKKATGAKAFSSELEPVEDTEAFDPGTVFNVGNLHIDTRQTSGHSRGGTTYVVQGLDRLVAVVGDALFAASMGGGMVSYEQALRTNRSQIFSLPDETILCPGHGPMTTVGEEKLHNPFFPEFQRTGNKDL
jgi:glyoxylase-like metal-dependent hydrolase (beta-lactamase superfamily II)